ncbi:MAG: hypothetical protein K2F85_00900, partial [Helicobacter sp.]|nr:hypothetical protein [Helicobacter sp.]
MQIAIKGFTNDYAQYLQDKLDARSPKIGEKEKREIHDSFRNSSYAELQETAANPQGKGVVVIDMEVFEMADLLRTVKGYQYSNPYTSLNIVGQKSTTEMGDRSTIDTPLGEMRIGVRFDEKTTLYLDNLAQLAAFDTNNDGFLSSSDLSAKNLVLIGYDKDGAEIEMSLLDVLGRVELTQFFDYSKNGIEKSFAAILRPEESHEQLKKENILEFFKTYADKSGWIDFTNPDIAERIFGSNELDLSYRQKNADGTTRLKRISFNESIGSLRKMQAKGEKSFGWEYYAGKTLKGAGSDYRFNLNDVGALERLKNGSMSYEYDSNLRYMNGHHPSDRYDILIATLNGIVKDIENTNMHNGTDAANRLARDFHDFTGMNYSESNLAKVKEGLARGDMEFLNTLTTQIDSVDYLGGTSEVVGMQLNDIAGNITLLFASGNEIKINLEDLYSGNGELNVDADGNRASLMNEAREMSEENLNNLDFAQVGIKDETGTIVSLKDLGITAIQKATYPDGRFLSFILTNADGNKINAQDLYNIFFVTSGGLES